MIIIYEGLHMILKLKSSENCVFGVKTHLEAKPLLMWDHCLEMLMRFWRLPGWLSIKESSCNAEDSGSISG